jgi:hypothetical protein
MQLRTYDADTVQQLLIIHKNFNLVEQMNCRSGRSMATIDDGDDESLVQLTPARGAPFVRDVSKPPAQSETAAHFGRRRANRIWVA